MWAVVSASGRVRTSRSASVSNGRNIAWDNLGHDQPFVDNGRFGKVQDNSQPLECGCRCGELGEIFFQFLHNDPFAKHTGNKLCTMLKKRTHSWMVSENGASRPKESAVPSEACSLGEVVMSLIAEERKRQLFTARGYSDRDDIVSVSSGSMSPDLGDKWHQGLPVSPQWEGGLELDSDNDCEDENEYEDEQCC